MGEQPIALSKEIIFRDDDISFATDMVKFIRVQDIFDKYGILHTIALVTKDIGKAPELIKFINTHNIDVQIHCYEHIDYSLEINEWLIEPQLKESIEIVKRFFNKTPTVFYPPWNKSCKKLKEVCTDLGLIVSFEKISLPAYIRAGGGISQNVINFHYWAEQEVMHLEIALKMYSDSKTKCI